MVFNEEDLLRLINRLLERLHQADGEKNSSHITLNYIASGAQYVNHIDTQVFDSAKLQKPCPGCACRSILPTGTGRPEPARRRRCSYGRPDRCLWSGRCMKRRARP